MGSAGSMGRWEKPQASGRCSPRLGPGERNSRPEVQPTKFVWGQQQRRWFREMPLS